MRKVLPIILLFLFNLSSHFCIAQAPPVFDAQVCLGGTGTDVGNKIIRSNDGGYLVTGYTTSADYDVTLNHGAADFWVVKIDISGTVQWKKTFGGTGGDFATSILELNNNDIVVSGYTFSNNGDVNGNHGLSDYWLIKITSTGNLIWQKTYGGSSYDICYSMTLAADSGFVLAGSSSSVNGNVTGNHGLKDFWIVKTDSDGNLQWQQSLGGTESDECYAIKSTSDSGFVVAGYTDSNDGDVTGNHGGYDYWVVKLDETGTVLWQKCLGGTLNEVGLATLENSSGNLMVGGYANSNDGDVTGNHGSSDYWMVWLDQQDGSLLSQRSYGGSNSDILFDFMPTADHGFILGGGSISTDFDVVGNHGGEDYWLLKTDSAGNIVWSRSYGGSSNDRAASLVQTDDGGFTEIGYTYSNDADASGIHGGADVWFLKLSCLDPVSNFQVQSDTLCIHSTLNLINTSVHAAVSKWQLDDVDFSSGTNTTIQFNNLGVYKVTLITYTCYATDTLSRYITVVDFPAPSITSDQSYLCSGGTATLSTDPADGYLWNTGDTTSSTIISSGGVYTVTVTAHGCSSSASYSINQFQNPAFDLGTDSVLCIGSSILILQAPPGYQSYIWQDSSTNSAFMVTSAGLYSVTVNDGFCNGSASIHVIAVNCPVANFSSSQVSVCQNGCINFTDLSANALGWHWQFPGSSTPSSDLQSPTNICYNVPGVYTVILIVDGASGTSTAIVRPDYITVNATPDNPVISAVGNFMTSTFASSYQWFFENTAISGATSQTYSATLTGNYAVMIQDANGCTAFSDPVYINVTGINNPVEESGISIFPNPSKGVFYISISDDKLRNGQIEITDVAGKIIQFSPAQMSNGKSDREINLEQFSNGIYFLKVAGDSGVTFRKLVIQK